MEFVEQHGGNAIEGRIVENKPREHAFSDDLDARAFCHLRIEPHAKTDGVADLFAQGRRHTRGGSAGRKPARLQHQNFPVFRPRLVEQHQRHARRLAGAWWSDQHGGIVARERRGELRQRDVDWQRCIESSHDLRRQHPESRMNR